MDNSGRTPNYNAQGDFAAKPVIPGSIPNPSGVGANVFGATMQSEQGIPVQPEQVANQPEQNISAQAEQIVQGIPIQPEQIQVAEVQENHGIELSQAPVQEVQGVPIQSAQMDQTVDQVSAEPKNDAMEAIRENGVDISGKGIKPSALRTLENIPERLKSNPAELDDLVGDIWAATAKKYGIEVGK